MVYSCYYAGCTSAIVLGCKFIACRRLTHTHRANINSVYYTYTHTGQTLSDRRTHILWELHVQNIVHFNTCKEYAPLARGQGEYTPLANCFNITYIPWEVHARNIAAGPASWKKCTRCPNATEFQPMGPGNICAAKNGRI